MSIPFETINAAALAALPSLLGEWFPQGVRRGHEFVIGDLRGSPGESLSININTAKWADFASDAKGGDVISICAAAFHGGDRVAAAKDLGRKLGVYMNGSATLHVVPDVAPTAAKQADTWHSSDPPDDAGAPPLGGFDAVYTYRSADGLAIRYVGRKNARGDTRKVYIPITYGELNGVVGWHKKHPNEPRRLYGLDRLAAMPERTVVICEGEKAADAAQAMLPEYPCVTWSAGTANVGPNDWAILAGRRIIIWPDNDGTGHKAAAAIRSILAPIARQIETLHVDDLPDGADAADVSPSDPVAWLRARLTAPEPPPVDDYAESDRDDEPVAPSSDEGIIPLGHDRGIFYYYSRSGRQVCPLAAAAHSKNTLTAMASVAHFWQRSRHVSEKGAILWDDAIDWMMRECRNIGIYDPDRIRGRGAWIDGGRAVLHVGDKLIVDGKPVPLMLGGSRFIYEAAKQLVREYSAALSTTEANKLVELCRAPTWQHGISGLLLSGFIVVAPICGGLSWRPSIWITGGAGSGKSWLKDNILAPAMGGVALLVQSKTSEAGIRQTLGCDALPVLFDEAEREDASAASRMQGVLDLLRQSSSEGGAEIVKGSSSQTGAKRYRIRSCFALSSINVGIEHQADESRVTVLALRDRDPLDDQADARFVEINKQVQATITPTFAAGLLARSVRLLPIIRENAETFARAVSVVFGSRRTGDQLGALLSGAYSLHSDRAISQETAEAWVRKQDWGTAVACEVERDELRLLSHLTQHRVRFSQGNSSSVEATIGRLLLARSGNDQQINIDVADLELKQIGIRYDAKAGKWGVYISTNHPALKRILVGTPWSAGWARALGRLPGAVTGDQKNVRFAFGHVGKACWVPMEAIDGPEDG